MTPFQQSMLATEDGSQRVPTVYTENGGTIPFAGYQLATHVYDCLKGKSAKDCLPELQQMQEMYRTNSQNN